MHLESNSLEAKSYLSIMQEYKKSKRFFLLIFNSLITKALMESYSYKLVYLCVWVFSFHILR